MSITETSIDARRLQFSDLVFTPGFQDAPDLHKYAIVDFPNGYRASVICGIRTYGGNQGLYEIGIIADGTLCYDTPITNDVIGYLNESEVEEVLGRIQDLPKRAAKSAA